MMSSGFGRICQTPARSGRRVTVSFSAVAQGEAAATEAVVTQIREWQTAPLSS